jgi:hypothetical protein
MLVDQVVGMFLFEERDDFLWEVVYLFFLSGWGVIAAVFEFLGGLFFFL